MPQSQYFAAFEDQQKTTSWILLIDSYLKMIEESEKKRKVLMEKIKDKEDNQKNDEVDTRLMEQASLEYTRNFAYE